MILATGAKKRQKGWRNIIWLRQRIWIFTRKG
jgi:hypothetical protein